MRSACEYRVNWSLWAVAVIAVVLQQGMARGTDNIQWDLCESNFWILNILLQQVDFHYRHMLPCVLLMCGLTQRDIMETSAVLKYCFKKQYRQRNDWFNTVFLTERKTNYTAVLRYNSIQKVQVYCMKVQELFSYTFLSVLMFLFSKKHFIQLQSKQ